MAHLILNIAVDTVRLAIWLALLAGIFVPLERFFALQNRARRSGLAQDLGLYFLNSLLPGLLLGAPMALVVTVTHKLLPSGYFAWIAALPIGLQLAAAFLIGEAGFYWGHRLTHAWPLLWRFHAVHHAPGRLDWLINTRAHPVDIIFTRLCGLVPLYALGLAGRQAAEGNLAAILLVILGTLWGFFLHANVRFSLGPLENVVASPRFHHWHHTRLEPLDRNFASMLPLMDRLFGTLYLPKSGWPREYGLAESPILREDTVKR